MEVILSVRAELRDFQRQIQENQRQIQDLDAPYIRSDSPLGRDNRAPFPAMRRGPHSEQPSWFDRTPRVNTAPPEGEGLYIPQPQLPPRHPYSRREYTHTAPNLLRAGTAAPGHPEPRRECQMSEDPVEIPPFRPSGDARVTV